MDNIEPKRGAGGHCEQRLMREFGRKVKTIIIMRIGKNGEIAPIDPCETCSKIANKMGVKIITVSPEDV